MSLNASVEDLKCDCGKTFKNKAGLGAHRRFAHGLTGASGIRPPLGVPGEGKPEKEEAPSSKVSFTSPKSAALRIVVKPSYWTQVQTPGGTKAMVIQGKTAEFLDGRYITDDLEIIDYLENKYKDDRYPILSDRKMRGMGKGL